MIFQIHELQKYNHHINHHLYNQHSQSGTSHTDTNSPICRHWESTECFYKKIGHNTQQKKMQYKIQINSFGSVQDWDVVQPRPHVQSWGVLSVEV